MKAINSFFYFNMMELFKTVHITIERQRYMTAFDERSKKNRILVWARVAPRKNLSRIRPILTSMTRTISLLKKGDSHD